LDTHFFYRKGQHEMKRTLLTGLLVLIQGCASHSTSDSSYTPQSSTDSSVQESESLSLHSQDQTCLGSTALPPTLAGQFDAVNDPTLLQEAIGKPEKGKLCQGKVYQSKPQTKITVYRAWNSTNPNSQYGQWWAFNKPEGRIAQYRSDYEICYQWSPLDKMVSCTLKAGTKIVVGNGQSASCSEYLSYPVSAKQQIYLVDAQSAVENCTNYDGVMSWK
jgi:hypothetical protein